MREREVRRRTVRQHDLIDECIKIDRVFIEAAHVALARIAQRALRQSLPAPVERRDREAARAQIADGLKVFLDELRTPLNAIIGFSTIMRDGMFGPLSAKYAEYATAIADSGTTCWR